MGSARICLQWALVVFNTLSVIIGILGIIICVFEIDRYTPGSRLYTENIVQLIGASILVFSAFIGCCGAVNASIKVIGIFMSMLLGLAFLHIWKLFRYDEKKLLEASGDIVKHAWLAELVRPGGMHSIQERYECCGKESYTDYTSLGLRVPTVCTHLKSFPYVEGCLYVVKNSYLNVYRYEKIATASVLAFECLGILLSIILICKLNSKKTRRYQY